MIFEKIFNIINLKYFVFFVPLALLTGPFLPDLLVTLSVIILLYYCIKNNCFKLIFFSKNIIFLYLFYFYLLLSSLLSEDILHSLTSSLPIIRLFFFIILINFLYEKNDKFFAEFLPYIIIAITIVIFSGYFQFINNIDKENFSQITGIFFDEKIMGSYLSRIAPLIFSLLLVDRNYFESFKRKILLIICFIIIAVLIILSGERAATVNLLTYTVLIVLFNVGNVRRYLIVSFIIILVPLTLIYLSNIYKFRIINETIEFSGINQNKILFFSDHHHLHMLSAIEIFKDNIYIGAGPKMFRIKCKDPKYFRDKNSIYNKNEINLLERDKKIRLNSLNGCSTHPHHIYLQLLSETGSIGLIFFCFFIFYLIKTIYFISKNDELIYFKYSLTFLILTNFSPLTPSGNIFNNFFDIMLIIPIALFFSSQSRNY